MVLTLTERKIFVQLGHLLNYPDTGLVMQTKVACRLLAGRSPQAAEALSQFLEAIITLSPSQQEEAFTRAFDVQPQCIPYLSVFLFGEENFKRGELMSGFAKAYTDAGIEPGGELPDHIGVVLRRAECFPEEDWEEVARWCIPGPVKEMVRSLDRSKNPYAHLLEAVLSLFEHEYPRESNHG